MLHGNPTVCTIDSEALSMGPPLERQGLQLFSLHQWHRNHLDESLLFENWGRSDILGCLVPLGRNTGIILHRNIHDMYWQYSAAPAVDAQELLVEH